MKKVLAAIAVAVSTTAVSAAELTVNYNRDATNKINGGGLSLGATVDKATVAVSFDRFVKGTDVDAYGLTGSYEIFKLGKLGVSGQLGLSYLDVERGRNGFAGTVGLGVAYPITKNMSLVADAVRIMPEDKLKSHEATIVSTGIRFKF